MVAQTNVDYDPIEQAWQAAEDWVRQQERESRQERRLALDERKEQRQSDAEARRVAAAEARVQRAAEPVTETPAKLSAPTTRLPGAGVVGGVSRETATRLIVVMIVLSAGGVIARSAMSSKTIGPDVVKVGQHAVKVPSHLRALGATFIIGTISLVVAELSPGGGLALMGAFTIVVAADLFGAGNLTGRLSNGLLGERTKAPNDYAFPTVPATPGNPTPLQNPTAPFHKGKPAPAPWHGQQGKWTHEGNQWVWVPSL